MSQSIVSSMSLLNGKIKVTVSQEDDGPRAKMQVVITKAARIACDVVLKDESDNEEQTSACQNADCRDDGETSPIVFVDEKSQPKNAALSMPDVPHDVYRSPTNDFTTLIKAPCDTNKQRLPLSQYNVENEDKFFIVAGNYTAAEEMEVLRELSRSMKNKTTWIFCHCSEVHYYEMTLPHAEIISLNEGTGQYDSISHILRDLVGSNVERCNSSKKKSDHLLIVSQGILNDENIFKIYEFHDIWTNGHPENKVTIVLASKQRFYFNRTVTFLLRGNVRYSRMQLLDRIITSSDANAKTLSEQFIECGKEKNVWLLVSDLNNVSEYYIP